MLCSALLSFCLASLLEMCRSQSLPLEPSILVLELVVRVLNDIPITRCPYLCTVLFRSLIPISGLALSFAALGAARHDYDGYRPVAAD